MFTGLLNLIEFLINGILDAIQRFLGLLGIDVSWGPVDLG